MTVVSRAVREAPQKPFGKRSGPCLAPSIDAKVNPREAQKWVPGEPHDVG